MKSILTAVLLLVLSLQGLPAQPHLEWRVQPLMPYQASMHAITMRQADTGIAVGEAGIVRRYRGIVTKPAVPDVAFTTTFVPDMPSMQDVAYNGSGIAVAVGVGGQIWRSSDDGATWIFVESVATDTLHAIYGSNKTFVAVGNNVISISVDDGTTWTTESRSGRYCDVAGNTSQGWMVVGSSVLFSNSGNNWDIVTPKLDVAYQAVQLVSDELEPSSMRFIVAADPFYTAWTSNNGSSWTDATLPNDIRAKYSRARTTCFATQGSGSPTIWMLDDPYLPASITLIARESDLFFVEEIKDQQTVDFIFEDIAFVNPSLLIGVGAEGQCYSFKYNKLTIRLSFRSDVIFSSWVRDLYVRGSTSLVVADESKVIVARSTDSGANYTTLFQGADGTAGRGGVISKTGTYLVMYDTLNTDNTDPTDIKHPSCIMRSSDRGASWSRTFIHPKMIMSIGLNILPSGRVIAQTYGNTWYSSNDDGESWQTVTLGNPNWYFQAGGCFYSNNVWYTPGYSDESKKYTLFRTLDGGNHWQEKTLPVGCQQLAFTSTDTGYAACRYVNGQQGDALYRTVDGADTWTVLYSSANGLGLNCLAIDSANKVLIASGLNGHTVVMRVDSPSLIAHDSSLKDQLLYIWPSKIILQKSGSFTLVGSNQNLYHGILSGVTSVSSETVSSTGSPLVSLFPNPTNSIVNVASTSDATSYRVVSADGIVMQARTPISSATFRITVDQYPSGMYFVQVYFADGKDSTLMMQIIH